MKIAYFVSRFPYLYQTFIRREINAVADTGIDITIFPVVGARRKHNLDVDFNNPVSANVEHTPPFSLSAFLFFISRRGTTCLRLFTSIIFHTWRHPLDLLKSVITFFKCFKMATIIAKGNFDHIHAHWATHPTTAALIISELTDTPFSFAFHAYDIFATRIMIPQKTKKAAFVIVNCRYTLDYISETYPELDRDKFILLYNGLDLKHFEQIKIDKPDTPPLLIAIGQFVPFKGFDDFLEACHLLKNDGESFSAMLIGAGPLEARFRKIMKEKGLNDIVRLTGELTEKETQSYLSTASVLIMPSLELPGETHDALPNVVIEAQAIGIPVVATDVFGIPEIVKHEETGLLIPQHNPTAIKDAVKSILHDPEKAKQHAENAKRNLKDKFDSQTNAKKLVSLFCKFSKTILTTDGHG